MPILSMQNYHIDFLLSARWYWLVSPVFRHSSMVCEWEITTFQEQVPNFSLNPNTMFMFYVFLKDTFLIRTFNMFFVFDNSLFCRYWTPGPDSCHNYIVKVHLETSNYLILTYLDTMHYEIYKNHTKTRDDTIRLKT